MLDGKKGVGMLAHQVVMLASVALIVLTVPAIGHESDIRKDSYRHIYWSDWRTGIGDPGFQKAPDASGRQAVTHLWKDGVSVFDGSGRPNAYPGDMYAYLKFGVYTPDWLKSPSDIDAVTLYFGEVSVGMKEEGR